MTDAADSTTALLAGAQNGHCAAFNELFARHRDRLRRMVQSRLDHRLRGRVDASDVIQEAHLEAVRRLDDYLRDPKVPPFLWLRLLVADRIMKVHRQHLGTQMRDAAGEVPLYRLPMPDASSAALAAQFLGHQTSPSQAAIRAEQVVRVKEALNALEPIDREILTLRHFEHLSRTEAALVLGIEEGSATRRYVHALRRLKGVLTEPDDE
jgi:RNA polymerase sigma-70 factor (ECF subfamily)